MNEKLPVILLIGYDVWDAQKDMLADTLGALFATIVFAMFNRKQIQALVRQRNLSPVNMDNKA